MSGGRTEEERGCRYVNVCGRERGGGKGGNIKRQERRKKRKRGARGEKGREGVRRGGRNMWIGERVCEREREEVRGSEGLKSKPIIVLFKYYISHI